MLVFFKITVNYFHITQFIHSFIELFTVCGTKLPTSSLVVFPNHLCQLHSPRNYRLPDTQASEILRPQDQAPLVGSKRHRLLPGEHNAGT